MKNLNISTKMICDGHGNPVVFIVMAKTITTNVEYIDSVWTGKDNAIKRAQRCYEGWVSVISVSDV